MMDPFQVVVDTPGGQFGLEHVLQMVDEKWMQFVFRCPMRPVPRLAKMLERKEQEPISS
jgi:hypothetical protein